MPTLQNGLKIATGSKKRFPKRTARVVQEKLRFEDLHDAEVRR